MVTNSTILDSDNLVSDSSMYVKQIFHGLRWKFFLLQHLTSMTISFFLVVGGFFKFCIANLTISQYIAVSVLTL